MSILLALALGILQGLTEFLPVSSSGHLLIVQKIFGLDEMLFFNILLHLGTLFAVCWVMRKEIWEMIKHPFSRKTLMLVLASAVTAAIYFLLKNFFDSAFEGSMLGYCFIVTAIILFVVESLPGGKRTSENMKWSDSVVMGLMQGLAILPGISRAGATLSGGMLSGMERKEAARFSFIMSIPVILGSFVLEGKDLISQPELMQDINWLPVIIGVVAAAVSGFLAIRFMLKLIEKMSLKIFSAYVGGLGLLILADQWFFHIINWGV